MRAPESRDVCMGLQPHLANGLLHEPNAANSELLLHDEEKTFHQRSRHGRHALYRRYCLGSPWDGSLNRIRVQLGSIDRKGHGLSVAVLPGRTQKLMILRLPGTVPESLLFADRRLARLGINSTVPKGEIDDRAQP